MNFNKLLPEISVSDISNTLDFYVRIIGFKIEYERKEDKFAFLSLNGSQLMVEQDNGHWETAEIEYPRGRGINFQFEVSNLEEIFTRAIDSQIKPFRDISVTWRQVNKTEYGEKEFLIQDPDGYLLRFSESIGERSLD
jgi:predicted enzyme related to lactoylglutathione lyase